MQSNEIFTNQFKQRFKDTTEKMSASSINRSLSTVRTELEFLKESNVISAQVFQSINEQLPDRYNPNESKDSLASHNEFVEAIYKFEPQQDGDLAISAGDKIEVLEKPSSEWYKGRCNGKVGMFPANYVKPAFSGNSSSSRVSGPPPPQYEQQSSQQEVRMQPSGNSYQQPMPYPPPSANYYQQQPQQQQPQQQPQQQQQQPEQSKHSGHLKNFGSQLGHAAIFGAGATIGSDLVNSIF